MSLHRCRGSMTLLLNRMILVVMVCRPGLCVAWLVCLQLTTFGGIGVVVVNAAKMSVTGNKMRQKVYHKHTGKDVF